MKRGVSMGSYVIFGGARLCGELRVGGSKNACLPLLSAAILNKDQTLIKNCPNILDVQNTVELLKGFGCSVQEGTHELLIDSSGLNSFSGESAGKLRSSISFLGALLGACKEAVLSKPGGCRIGERPIDLHLSSLRAMGAEISEDEDKITARARKLVGANIHLPFPSVGATENIILAAVLAEGITTIENAAREPEIADLVSMLNAMGAKIYGVGTSTIQIKGVLKLHDVKHNVSPDRIEAGTLLCSAAMTGGEIYLTNARPSEMGATLNALMQTGCYIEADGKSVYISAPDFLSAIPELKTAPYPAFPTDMQPELMSVLTRAYGTSMIVETVFEARLSHAFELAKMGAKISVFENRAIVHGVSRLRGTEVVASDLRGGAALILAGLAAGGKTTVCNSEYIERGYEGIEKKLAHLGADIRFIDNI